MKTNHYIGLAIAINVFVATILFALGSLLPYLQLYVYRVNLIENKPHNYFSINSSFSGSDLRHSFTNYLMNISKKNTPTFFKSVTNDPLTVFSSNSAQTYSKQCTKCPCNRFNMTFFTTSDCFCAIPMACSNILSKLIL